MIDPAMEPRELFSQSLLSRPGKEPGTPVWPVFVAYAAVFTGTLILGTILLIAGMAALIVQDPSLARNEQAMGRVIEEFAHSPWALIGSVLISSAALIAVPLVVLRLRRKQVRQSLRLDRLHVSSRAPFFATTGLLGLGQLPESFWALMGWSPGGVLETMPKVIQSANWSGRICLILVIGPVAGFAEELFFRGFMQTSLRDRWRPWIAVGITAIAFGLLHLDAVQSVFAVFAGVLLGWVTELTSSIRPAITAHAVSNSIGTAAAAIFPAPWSSVAHLWLLVLSLLFAAASIAVLARLPREARESALPGP